MNRTRAIVAATLVLVGGGFALAHEGHTHTVMGTVTAVTETHLTIKTTDGKDVSISVNANTGVTKGKSTLALKDVATGQRVVVDIGDGKTPLVARGIKLGVAAPAAKAPAGSAPPRS